MSCFWSYPFLCYYILGDCGICLCDNATLSYLSYFDKLADHLCLVFQVIDTLFVCLKTWCVWQLTYNHELAVIVLVFSLIFSSACLAKIIESQQKDGHKFQNSYAEIIWACEFHIVVFRCLEIKHMKIGHD